MVSRIDDAVRGEQRPEEVLVIFLGRGETRRKHDRRERRRGVGRVVHDPTTRTSGCSRPMVYLSNLCGPMRSVFTASSLGKSPPAGADMVPPLPAVAEPPPLPPLTAAVPPVAAALVPPAELPAVALPDIIMPPPPAAGFAPADPPLLLVGVLDGAFMPALPALEPPAGAVLPPVGVVVAGGVVCMPWPGVIDSGVLLPHAEQASQARLTNQGFAAMNGREICIVLSRKQPAPRCGECRALAMPRQKSPA